RAPATPELYTLSLHDALPISAPDGADAVAGRDRDAAREAGNDTVGRQRQATGLRHHDDGGAHRARRGVVPGPRPRPDAEDRQPGDRKSTRLNSSHVSISYAVF